MIARAAAFAGMMAAAIVAQAPGAGGSRQHASTVDLFVTLQTPDGAPADDVTAADLELFDDGHAVEIVGFVKAPREFNGAVIVDVSGSMNMNADRLRAAASEMGAHLQTGDRVLLATVAADICVAPEPAMARADLIRAAGLLSQPAGPTRLWDAIDDLMTALGVSADRRVIVAYTDGRANANVHDANSVAERAVAGGYQVYFLSPWEEDQADIPGFIPPGRVLEQFARATGGARYVAKGREGAWTILGGRRPSEIGSMFGRVIQEVRGQYKLTFSSTAEAGTFQRLELRVRRPGVTARTRLGYSSGP